jgi:hypothetical protein
MLPHAGDVDEEPGGECEADEFDRQVGRVLETRAEWLRERSAELISNGSASMAIDGAALYATLRLPRWWRPGELKISGKSSPGGGFEQIIIPLHRSDRDRDRLAREIVLQFAVMLADAGPAEAAG